jgi:hypothetical protein
MKSSISLALAFTFVLGCSDLWKECRVPVLKPMPGLEVLAETRDVGECLSASDEPIPLTYKLELEECEILIAVGERWYPRLYLDAVDAEGGAVTIVSDQAVIATKGGAPSPVTMHGGVFRYFVHTHTLEEGQPVALHLSSPLGKPLGEIVLEYELVSGIEFDPIQL